MNGMPEPDPKNAAHRRRLERLREDMESVEGTARQMRQRIDQILEHGGTLDAQKQIAFMTGAYARFMKDWGCYRISATTGRRPKAQVPLTA